MRERERERKRERVFCKKDTSEIAGEQIGESGKLAYQKGGKEMRLRNVKEGR